MKIRRNGSWVNANSVKVRRNGAWVNATHVRVRRNGAWVTVWQSQLVATPSSVYVNEQAGTGSAFGSVTLSKPATGQWKSGGAGISVSGSGTDFLFSAESGNSSNTKSGTYRFTPTDGTAVLDISVTFIFN